MTTTPDSIDATIEKQQGLPASKIRKLLNISASMLNKLTMRAVNPIPSFKMGKSRRYPLDQVLIWRGNNTK